MEKVSRSSNGGGEQIQKFRIPGRLSYTNGGLDGFSQTVKKAPDFCSEDLRKGGNRKKTSRIPKV